MVKDAVPLRTCGRALVVKLGEPCDVLLAAPVLSVLGARGVEVDVLVYEDTAPLLEGHPALSRLHVAPRAFSLLAEARLIAALRARRYGLLVHLGQQALGARLARTIGVRYRVAPHGAAWRRSFTHLYPLARRRHQVELHLDALRRIGVYPEPDERGLRFVPGTEAERRVASLVPETFIQVDAVPAWPPEKQAELIDRLAAEGHRVVVTASAGRGLVEEILKKNARAVDLARPLSFKELGALAARARLFVGGESAALQLAAAMGTPVVALFGGPERAPWNVPHRSLANGASVAAAHAAVRELIPG